MFAQRGQGRAPPGAGARTVSLFSAEKREMVLDSKEKRIWLIIGASPSYPRRPGFTGLLVEDAATGRRNAVPGIGLALLLQPPWPPLGTMIVRLFPWPSPFTVPTHPAPELSRRYSVSRESLLCFGRTAPGENPKRGPAGPLFGRRGIPKGGSRIAPLWPFFWGVWGAIFFGKKIVLQKPGGLPPSERSKGGESTPPPPRREAHALAHVGQQPTPRSGGQTSPIAGANPAVCLFPHFPRKKYEKSLAIAGTTWYTCSSVNSRY